MATANLEILLELQDRVSAQLGRVETALRGIGTAAGQSSGPLDGLSGALGRTAERVGALLAEDVIERGFGALNSAVRAATDAMLNYNASLERAALGYRVLLDSADAADAKVKQLVAFANSNPLDTASALEAGRRLLFAGEAATNLQADLQALGNIGAASGQLTAEWLTRVASEISEVGVRGKLTGVQIRAFGNEGVPAIQALAETLHISRQEVSKLIEEGQIGFPLLLKALRDFSDTHVPDALERFTHTFSGALEVIRTNIQAGLAAGFEEGFKEAEKLLDNFATVLRSSDFNQFVANFANGFRVLLQSIGGDIGGAINTGELTKRLQDAGHVLLQFAAEVDGVVRSVGTILGSLGDILGGFGTMVGGILGLAGAGFEALAVKVSTNLANIGVAMARGAVAVNALAQQFGIGFGVIGQVLQEAGHDIQVFVDLSVKEFEYLASQTGTLLKLIGQVATGHFADAQKTLAEFHKNAAEAIPEVAAGFNDLAATGLRFKDIFSAQGEAIAGVWDKANSAQTNLGATIDSNNAKADAALSSIAARQQASAAQVAAGFTQYTTASKGLIDSLGGIDDQVRKDFEGFINFGQGVAPALAPAADAIDNLGAGIDKAVDPAKLQEFLDKLQDFNTSEAKIVSDAQKQIDGVRASTAATIAQREQALRERIAELNGQELKDATELAHDIAGVREKLGDDIAEKRRTLAQRIGDVNADEARSEADAARQIDAARSDLVEKEQDFGRQRLEARRAADKAIEDAAREHNRAIEDIDRKLREIPTDFVTVDTLRQRQQLEEQRRDAVRSRDRAVGDATANAGTTLAGRLADIDREEVKAKEATDSRIADLTRQATEQKAQHEAQVARLDEEFAHDKDLAVAAADARIAEIRRTADQRESDRRDALEKLRTDTATEISLAQQSAIDRIKQYESDRDAKILASGTALFRLVRDNQDLITSQNGVTAAVQRTIDAYNRLAGSVPTSAPAAGSGGGSAGSGGTVYSFAGASFTVIANDTAQLERQLAALTNQVGVTR